MAQDQAKPTAPTEILSGVPADVIVEARRLLDKDVREARRLLDEAFSLSRFDHETDNDNASYERLNARWRRLLAPCICWNAKLDALEEVEFLLDRIERSGIREWYERKLAAADHGTGDK